MQDVAQGGGFGAKGSRCQDGGSGTHDCDVPGADVGHGGAGEHISDRTNATIEKAQSEVSLLTTKARVLDAEKSKLDATVSMLQARAKEREDAVRLT